MKYSKQTAQHQRNLMKIQTLKGVLSIFVMFQIKAKPVEDDSDVAERVRPTSGVKKTYFK